MYVLKILKKSKTIYKKNPNQNLKIFVQYRVVFAVSIHRFHRGNFKYRFLYSHVRKVRKRIRIRLPTAPPHITFCAKNRRSQKKKKKKGK